MEIIVQTKKEKSALFFFIFLHFNLMAGSKKESPYVLKTPIRNTAKGESRKYHC